MLFGLGICPWCWKALLVALLSTRRPPDLQHTYRHLILPALLFLMCQGHRHPIVLYFISVWPQKPLLSYYFQEEGDLIYSEPFGAQCIITVPSNAWVTLSESIVSLWTCFYEGRGRVEQKGSRNVLLLFHCLRSGVSSAGQLLDKHFTLFAPKSKMLCYGYTYWGGGFRLFPLISVELLVKTCKLILKYNLPCRNSLLSVII